MRDVLRLVLLCLFSVASGQVSAVDTIKVAFIDALSGEYADIGFDSLNQFQAAIAYTNANGGALGLDLELVPLDDQSSVERALEHLDLALGQGIRYVTQGNNPEVTVALAKAIDAHNAENPGRAVLFLNYGDGAPQLDNLHCSFWHFRFDASLEMKLRTLVDGIPADGSVQSAYLLNQDNAWGHQASREIQRMLSKLRPEIQIVGDEVHPGGSDQDLSVYVQQAMASDADAIITADRGADLERLISAVARLGGRTPVFIASNVASGVPAAIGVSGSDRVTGVFTWHANIGSNLLSPFARSYRETHGEDWNGLASYVTVQMLAASIQNARSSDPVQVARVLEGLSFLGVAGPTAMREDNHQLLQPLFLSRLVNPGSGTNANMAVDSGLAWQTLSRSEPDETALETACKMQRPKVSNQ
ncbi:MAG TPA: branched-chain amino acid ABC transporter substrate-binding protein [Burkholderiales bacterium]|nr:branched-chain amino acid ABC transporter substrate-binding protein [Burkholderiales bacterium]